MCWKRNAFFKFGNGINRFFRQSYWPPTSEYWIQCVNFTCEVIGQREFNLALKRATQCFDFGCLFWKSQYRILYLINVTSFNGNFSFVYVFRMGVISDCDKNKTTFFSWLIKFYLIFLHKFPMRTTVFLLFCLAIQNQNRLL